MPVKFQRDKMIMTCNLAASRLLKIWWIEALAIVGPSIIGSNQEWSDIQNVYTPDPSCDRPFKFQI